MFGFLRGPKKAAAASNPGTIGATSPAGAAEAAQRVSEREKLSALRFAIPRYLLWVILLGAIGALGPPLCQRQFEAAATVALWILACLSCGLLGGFLFGIPKVLQGYRTEEGFPAQDTSENPKSRVEKTAASAPRMESPYSLQVNTNLEQISDWLCKIIVGLGLIELRNVPTHLGSLSTGLSSDLQGGFTPSFASGMIVFFSVIGFLFGYLATRLFLAGEFGRADRDAVLGEARVQAQQAIDERLAEKVSDMDIKLAITAGKIAQQSDDLLTLNFAVGELTTAHQSRPTHRRAVMVLSTLLAKQGKQEEAVAVLDNSLRAKAAQGTDKDNDAADMHFNRACFLGQLARKVGVPADRQAVYRQEMLQALSESITLKSANAAEAWRDDDLAHLHDDPDFKRIVGPKPPTRTQ